MPQVSPPKLFVRSDSLHPCTRAHLSQMNCHVIQVLELRISICLCYSCPSPNLILLMGPEGQVNAVPLSLINSYLITHVQDIPCAAMGTPHPSCYTGSCESQDYRTLLFTAMLDSPAGQDIICWSLRKGGVVFSPAATPSTLYAILKGGWFIHFHLSYLISSLSRQMSPIASSTCEAACMY